jgi:TRAP transporter TAXI family solute receptor
MIRESLEFLTRRDMFRLGILLVALLAVAVWGALHFLASATPRHIVLASGAPDGMYHAYALRYKEILARDGVTVEERMTDGAAENFQLLLDPKSRVDVAFAQGGVAPANTQSIEMLATLYYEPLWLFYPKDTPFTKVTDLLYKRIAIGKPGSGTRVFTEPLLAANGITPLNTQQVSMGAIESLRALQRSEIDFAVLVGPVQAPAIWQALHDPSLKVAPFVRADAYERRFPYISKLRLPQGAVELAQNIPDADITLIGTKSMLVARPDFPPALINLLLDAAHEIHGGQGYFEAANEFPATARLDLDVSQAAERHKQFGPNLLHRYMPFWAATLVERLIILVVPLLVIVVPLINYLPQLLRWRVRSRIFRLYGELKLLERDVYSRKGALPTERWLQDLDRIEHSAQSIKTPISFASEAYTLREHIRLVRRAVQAKVGALPA